GLQSVDRRLGIEPGANTRLVEDYWPALIRRRQGHYRRTEVRVPLNRIGLPYCCEIHQRSLACHPVGALAPCAAPLVEAIGRQNATALAKGVTEHWLLGQGF